MKKQLVISAAIGVALIGGVAFAVSEPTTPNVIEQPATITKSAPSMDTTPAQTALKTSGEAATSATVSVSTAAQAPAVAPQSTPQPAATTDPADLPAPVTLLQVIGTGVSSNARPYIDSFTCTYQFSDGTSQSGSVVYGKDELDHAAANCPSWE